MQIISGEVYLLKRILTVEADKMKKSCRIKEGSGILKILRVIEQSLIDVIMAIKLNSVFHFLMVALEKRDLQATLISSIILSKGELVSRRTFGESWHGLALVELALLQVPRPCANIK